jgi:hypothetical protein
MNLQRDKENMIDYFRKEKSRSGNKNCTGSVIHSKQLQTKKSNSHNNDDLEYNSKRLRETAIQRNTAAPLNMTMNPKK